jgi:high-affinity nickel-transport protein
MNPLASILLLGFLLGVRHATDADHVVAVTTFVGRDKSLRGAALIGSLWGAGHTATVLLVGGALILFDLVIPPRVALAMELAVGLMLLLLGAWSLRATAPDADAHTALARLDQSFGGRRFWTVTRPLVVGAVHGLAGSAAMALLVLGTIRRPAWAVAYLLIFGAGTMAGMALITTALALPIHAAARRGAEHERWLRVAAGVLSITLGLFVVYRVGFTDGLFTGAPHQTLP